jgi:deoxyribodipyrimidine photo-lyase
MKSIFIFRRDFRLFDNHGIIKCLKESEEIILIFIFTPEQIINNKYFSSNAFQFLIESLEDLNKELKKYNTEIYFYFGENIEILKKIKKIYNYDAIYCNKDFTPYAIKRDSLINEYLEKEEKQLFLVEDYLLAPMNTFCKKDGTAYEVYGAFRKNSMNFTIEKVNSSFNINKNKFVSIKNNFNLKDLQKYYKINPNIMVHGGRKNALKIIEKISSFGSYEECRNILDYNTTHLSSYIKYGTISIREIYHKIVNVFGKECVLINQLFWREFYFYIGYYFPRVLEGKSLKEKYDKIIWVNNPIYIEAWKEAKTGYPVVDACIRELNTIGFMHNRGRLITSGILIKILQCDWRIGEEYFATKLIDYDPLVNNGNWQWSSSSGADSTPYFRIFNPWLQSKKFDPNCIYIKKWLPELKNVPNKEIHQWNKYYQNYKNINYNGPINNYEEARKETLDLYKKYLT